MPPAPLEPLPQPAWAERRARAEAEWELVRLALELSEREVGVLESSLRTDPNDLVARRLLLAHYRAALTAPGGGDEARQRRRAHVLWLVANRPESDLAGSADARLFAASGTDPRLLDAAGYAQARELWLTQANVPHPSAAVLANAAAFFEAEESEQAEALLLRARSLHPDGPWSARLGRLYASVVDGTWADTGSGLFLVSLGPRGLTAHPITAWSRLAESRDVEMLLAAARYVRRLPYADLRPNARASFYLERALLQDRESVPARVELQAIRSEEHARRAGEWLATIPAVSQLAAVAALPEAERFELLPDLVAITFGRAEHAARDEHGDLEAYVRHARQRADRLARDILSLAPRFRGHPRQGWAVYTAHMTLGSLAIQDGNRKAAVRSLRRATEATPCEELVYRASLGSWRLPLALLEAGERDSVVQFLEKMAAINVLGRPYLSDAAAAIRQGRMPRLDYPQAIEELAPPSPSC